MEKFNGCFIIANFDSLEGDNKESLKLLETLSANFNEKCVIAANDVSFPSNRARFSNRTQVLKNLPKNINDWVEFHDFRIFEPSE